MATNIELPDALSEQVDDVYEGAGYASKSEFVRDAVRRRLQDVTNE